MAAPSVVASVSMRGRVTSAPAAIAAASAAAPVVSTASTGTSSQPTRCMPPTATNTAPGRVVICAAASSIIAA